MNNIAKRLEIDIETMLTELTDMPTDYLVGYINLAMTDNHIATLRFLAGVLHDRLSGVEAENFDVSISVSE